MNRCSIFTIILSVLFLLALIDDIRLRDQKSQLVSDCEHCEYVKTAIQDNFEINIAICENQLEELNEKHEPHLLIYHTLRLFKG